MVESAFREALDMARNFKPSGDPQQILAKQGEMARKAFDAAIDHTKQIAEQVSRSQAEAMKIASDRIVASIAELRAKYREGRKGGQTEVLSSVRQFTCGETVYAVSGAETLRAAQRSEHDGCLRQMKDESDGRGRLHARRGERVCGFARSALEFHQCRRKQAPRVDGRTCDLRAPSPSRSFAFSFTRSPVVSVSCTRWIRRFAAALVNGNKLVLFARKLPFWAACFRVGSVHSDEDLPLAPPA